MIYIKNKMKQLVSSYPKFQVLLLLILLYGITIFHLPVITALLLLISCVGFTVGFDLLFAYIRRKKLFVPYAALVTGMILTLIIDPSANLVQIAVICAAAMAIKNFLRISNRHVLNPAASGLLVGWALFQLSPSWWSPTLYTPGAITLPNILVLVAVLLLAYVSGYRLKRYYTIITFLIAYTVLTIIFTQTISFSSLVGVILSPGTLFYTIVMLAEPMTSPVQKKRQILYGCIVTLLNVLFVFVVMRHFPTISFPDSSLVALLIGNVLFFKFR